MWAPVCFEPSLKYKIWLCTKKTCRGLSFRTPHLGDDHVCARHGRFRVASAISTAFVKCLAGIFVGALSSLNNRSRRLELAQQSIVASEFFLTSALRGFRVLVTSSIWTEEAVITTQVAGARPSGGVELLPPRPIHNKLVVV